MNVASLHLCVRNDKHCPECRMWYITAQSSNKYKDEVSPFATWVDEWVRRKNGDKYQTIFIITDKLYDLQEYHLDAGNERDINCKYLLVKMILNKSLWCPDNIQFYISFHQSVGKANACASSNDDEIYYKIIELKENDTVCLNELFEQLEPTLW